MFSMSVRRVFYVVLIISLFLNMWPAPSVSAEAPVSTFAETSVTTRYTISNSYITVSGINGTIDTLRFDKNGTSNYSGNIIKAGQSFYMYANLNGTVTSSASTQGNWTVSGNTLTITGLQFGSSGVTGDWTITLNGDTLQNSFSIKNTTGAPAKVLSSGYKLEIPFEKDGYDVTDNTKTLFSKYIASTDMYIDARGQKRVTADWVLDMPGEWLHAFGTNGYDLRFYPSQQIYSPYNHSDYQEMRFYANWLGDMENGTAGLAPGAQLTSTLDIEVLVPGVFTIPDSYPIFTSSDESLATSLNTMFYERSFGWWGSHTAGDWKEWMLMHRSWVDSYVRDVEREELLNTQQEPDGAIWSWGDRATWPFGPNHTTSTTNYINGAYRYFMATGDKQFLKASIDKMRKATNKILSFYNADDQIFIIDDGIHTGLKTQEGGNNYYDITPYGHKDAYYNIYAYQAIKNMADLENLLGNAARGTELTNLAQDVNDGYNEIFWNGDVYIQVIDVEGNSHNYDATYLNFEAINYGLATPERASHIIDYFTNKVSGSGEKDIFSKWVIAPRSYGDINPNNNDGGWWIKIYNPLAYDDQVQYGGTIFFYAYYEMMSRIKGKDSDNAYGRLKEIMNRFNQPDHLSGGEPLINGETMQHGKEGSLGLWGEFPENGIVPTIALYGFMGTEMDKDGLHITPNLPAELETLGIQKFNYNDMNLTIDTTATSVRISTTDTSPYTWTINGGTALTAPFDVTTSITPGETVTLQKTTETTIDLDAVPAEFIKVTYGAADNNISNKHTFTRYEPMNSGLNAYTFSSSSDNGIVGYVAEIEKPDGTKLYTDSSWKANSTAPTGWESDSFDDTAWSNAQSLGGYGVSPFGNSIVQMDGTKGKWIWSDTNNNTIMARSVTAAAYSSLPGWGAAKLTDGDTSTVWSSNIYSEANTTEYVTLDLGTKTNTSQINITPRAGGLGFPKDFSLQFSNDGTSWNNIRGMSYEDYVNPGSSVQTFMFPENIEARYLRIKATKLGTDDGGSFLMQLAEISAGGMEVMPKGKNSAIHPHMGYYVSSEIFSVSNIGDNNVNSVYSSNIFNDPNHTEWVVVDLGEAKTVGTVAIVPRAFGYCFPVDFKIQTSNDNVNWTDNLSYTNYANPGATMQTFNLPSKQEARYVRVFATKLSVDNGTAYGLQMAEIYVSAEKPLGASASSVASGTVARNAVDGNTGSPWMSSGHTDPNHVEWITVDMNASRLYDTINVVPRNVLPNATSNGFPQNFKFQFSDDGVNWTDIPGEYYNNYPIMPRGTQVFKLISPVKSRYMRMYATKLSRDDQGHVNYSFQLGDLDISYSGKSSLRKTFYGTTENKSLIAADASSFFTTGWEASNVIDNDPSSNWSSLGHVGASVTESVYVDVGSTQTIEQIRLLPRTGGYGFPVDFKFQHSTDGTSWTDIPGLSYTNYGNPGEQIEQTYALTTPVSARYVRLYATRLGNDESGTNVVQLANFAIDIAGNVSPPDQTPPVTTDDAPKGWTNQDVTVMLTAEDEESGVAETQYRINEGEWQTYSEPVAITTEGITTFEYRSIDEAGNMENIKTITIQLDKTAPTLEVVLDQTSLWPANHKLVTVNATVHAEDAHSLIDSIVLQSITSSEPDDGLGDGGTTEDIQDAEFGTEDLIFSLRAERSGQGEGRTYTITYVVTDKAGNRSTAQAIVTVPHDKKGK
jgi:hypothetical protein